MSAASAGAVVAAAGTAALLLAAPVRVRRPEPGSRRTTEQPALLLRLRPVLTALAFAGAWAFLGGPVGPVVGAAGATLAWRILGQVESPARRRRREELERDLPTAVHLLGAALAAGAATSSALAAVVQAMPGSVAEELALIRHRLDLGADPHVVWQDVAAHPQLRPLGRAMARAHRSGASVVGAIDALAAELTAQARARSEALARSVEVRAAGPLGACFLPAFVLLGVVPMVVAVFAATRLLG